MSRRSRWANQNGGGDTPCDAAECMPEGSSLVGDLRRAFADRRETLSDVSSCCLGSRHAAAQSQPTSSATTEDDLAAGTLVDDFEVITLIARGGMGEVYDARQRSLGRVVALKVLPTALCGNERAEIRFLAESHAAARVHHTNVIAIYGRGQHEGRLYYAMERIDGPSMDQVVRATPSWFDRDFRVLAERFANLADGLASVHRVGIVHRDIKPHNILISQTGRLVLTDFGVAQQTGALHLTGEGELLGTPAYLAPEQIASEGPVDTRTDVYALGVTLYESITGTRPFRGERREQTAQRILQGRPPSPRLLSPDVPEAIETICMRAMERNPSLRYPDATSLADDLHRFAAGRAIVTRRPGPLKKTLAVARQHWAIVVVAFALMAVGASAIAVVLNTARSRQAEAGYLLNNAWETLAFVEYKRGDELMADLERAADLNAPREAVRLAMALASLGSERTEEAISILEALRLEPQRDARADYLLAWALWRTSDRVTSREIRVEADGAGGPVTAEGWLFRGLATHFDVPSEAIDSYRQAIQIRAAEHEFYPLASLHLARAHNQRMYTSRDLESFTEAEVTLRRLAEAGVYGAYPHYLLSVAHRLAGDIYSAQDGPRDADRRDAHFQEALTWAREGQHVDPEHHYPVMAEAECLEAMGVLADAEAARTRSLTLAPSTRIEWEGYHYRWRLRYWLGDFDGALDDLARCQAFASDDRFYNHVYPALVLAELGQIDAAAERALAPAEESSPAGLLWAVSTLRLIGQHEDAEMLLESRMAEVLQGVDDDDAQWWRTLLGHARDGDRADELEAMTAAHDLPWRRSGEASFHDAARRLADGDVAGASSGFLDAHRAYDGERRYTYHGAVMWRRLHARTVGDSRKEGQ